MSRRQKRAQNHLLELLFANICGVLVTNNNRLHRAPLLLRANTWALAHNNNPEAIPGHKSQASATLVPKLHFGTQFSSQFHCLSVIFTRGAALRQTAQWSCAD